jgi:hypothetical protein
MQWLHQLSNFGGEFYSVGCAFKIIMKMYSMSRCESLKQVIGWTVYWSLYFTHLRNMRTFICQTVLGDWPLLPLLICEMLSSNLHLLAACLDWGVLCFSYFLQQMWGFYFNLVTTAHLSFSVHYSQYSYHLMLCILRCWQDHSVDNK